MMPLGNAAVRHEPPAKVVTEAEERGRRVAADALQAQLDAVRAEEKAAYEARLTAERRLWIEETAERISGQLADGLRAMEAALVDGAARVMQPFLDNAVRLRALDELWQTLALLRARRHVAIRITGPEELIAAIRKPLDAHVEGVQYSVGEGPTSVS